MDESSILGRSDLTLERKIIGSLLLCALVLISLIFKKLCWLWWISKVRLGFKLLELLGKKWNLVVFSLYMLVILCCVGVNGIWLCGSGFFIHACITMLCWC